MTEKELEQIAILTERKPFWWARFFQWPGLLRSIVAAFRRCEADRDQYMGQYREQQGRIALLEKLAADERELTRETLQKLRAEQAECLKIRQEALALRLDFEKSLATVRDLETRLGAEKLDCQCAKAELAKTQAQLERAELHVKTMQARIDESNKVMAATGEWIKESNRLAVPIRTPIRAALAAAGKALAALLVLLPFLVSAAPPPPIQRNIWTTNPAPGGVISLSTSNATSKPLTNSFTAAVLRLFGLEAGTGISLTMNPSNIVINSTGSASTGDFNTNQFSATTVTNLKAGAFQTNANFWGEGTNHGSMYIGDWLFSNDKKSIEDGGADLLVGSDEWDQIIFYSGIGIGNSIVWDGGASPNARFYGDLAVAPVDLGFVVSPWNNYWGSMGHFLVPTGFVETTLLKISNSPGLDRQILFWHTNGQGYTAFSAPTNAWNPTNRFFLTVTNPIAGQVLKVLNVSYANGVASIILTNDTDGGQPPSTTLTNLSGTGAITNLFSLSLSNGTIKPIVFGGVGDAAGMTNKTGQLYGLEAGANITLTLNGSNITISATAAAADSLWSSNNVTLFPGMNTNRVAIGTNSVGDASALYVLGYNRAFSGAQTFENFMQGPTEGYGLVVMAKPDGYAGQFMACIQSRNDVLDRGGNLDVLSGGAASYGIDCINTADETGSRIIGATCGVQGYAISANSINLGVSGIAGPAKATTTNIALAGVLVKSASLANTKDIGLYAAFKTTSEIATPATIVRSAVAVCDGWTSNVPLLVLQTNNGNLVAWVDNAGKIITTNDLLVVGSTLLIGSVTNGGRLNVAGGVTNYDAMRVVGTTDHSGAVTNESRMDTAGGVTNYSDFKVLGVSDFAGAVTNESRVNTAGGVTNWIQTESKGTLYASSNLLVKAGQSTSNAFVGGTTWFDQNSWTNHSANSASLTNLSTNIVAAHVLTNNGDMVHIQWRIKLANSAVNTNQFQLVYGSETVLDTGLQTCSNGTCTADLWITRTGNTSQHADGRFEWGGSGFPYVVTNNNVELVQTNGISTIFQLRVAARRPGSCTNNWTRKWYDSVVK